MKFHFKYEVDLEVTDERALTALVPDPLTHPERPMLASWHNISRALEMRLDEAISDAPGLQLLGGGFALTPLETGDAE